jgi:hypothetical protein
MDYVRTANRRSQVRKMLAFKNGVETVTLDYSPWSDDYGTVTAVTATVKSGQASIGNESLTSNVKSMTISTPETGASMITLTATAGNNTDISYLYVYSKDPNTVTEDYGLLFR